MQHVIVETAQMTSPVDEGWMKNGAGKHFNHKFGFGRMDAAKMVERVKTWTNVGPQKTCVGQVFDKQRWEYFMSQIITKNHYLYLISVLNSITLFPKQYLVNYYPDKPIIRILYFESISQLPGCSPVNRQKQTFKIIFYKAILQKKHFILSRSFISWSVLDINFIILFPGTSHLLAVWSSSFPQTDVLVEIIGWIN